MTQGCRALMDCTIESNFESLPTRRLDYLTYHHLNHPRPCASPLPQQTFVSSINSSFSNSSQSPHLIIESTCRNNQQTAVNSSASRAVPGHQLSHSNLRTTNTKRLNAKLNCLYTNATSLNSIKKRADLELRCMNKVDIIFVTETWFNQSSVVSLESFKIFRRDRDGHGGGVAIYVNNKLESFEICDNLLNMTLNPAGGDVEQIWCEITRHPGDGKVLLGCIYRPPLKSRSFEDKAKHGLIAEQINKSIAVASRAVEAGFYDGLCVTGDFNYPDLRWSIDTVMNCGKTDSLAGAFLDMLDSLSLHQSVCSPTFFSSDGRPTNIIDLIISERPERVDV